MLWTHDVVTEILASPCIQLQRMPSTEVTLLVNNGWATLGQAAPGAIVDVPTIN